VRVTRVRRTRYLAAAAPGSSRNGCSVRLTASREGRFLYGESTSPASPGLVWLTVTEVTGPQAVREAAALVAELARERSHVTRALAASPDDEACAYCGLPVFWRPDGYVDQGGGRSCSARPAGRPSTFFGHEAVP